jgi:hypothetical protein
MIGAVLPLIPGWIFTLPGLLMLASDVPFFARMVCGLESRIPRVSSAMQRVHKAFARLGAAHLSCPPPED